jgi:hypothetical protein
MPPSVFCFFTLRSKSCQGSTARGVRSTYAPPSTPALRDAGCGGGGPDEELELESAATSSEGLTSSRGLRWPCPGCSSDFLAFFAAFSRTFSSYYESYAECSGTWPRPSIESRIVRGMLECAAGDLSPGNMTSNPHILWCARASGHPPS